MSCVTTDRTKPSVRAVIVNYRTSEMVIDCLASLEAERDGSATLDVVVVDNASADQSLQLIKGAVAANGWEGWVTLVASGENRGFAAGNNIVLLDDQLSKPDYFWLLNPDTYARPRALEGLLEVMASQPRAGLAGSCLEWPDGVQQHSMFRFHTVGTEFFSTLAVGPLTRLFDTFNVARAPKRETARFDWLSGASLLVRAAVIDEIGGMDENYFLYFEETDFCLRAQQAGWDCWLAQQSRVVHLVGQSTGVTARERGSRRRPDYWFQSRRRYFEKHHGRFYADLADIALGTNVLINRAIAFVRRKPTQMPDRFLLDLVTHGLGRRWHMRKAHR
ncbi:MAG: glycosyltransferase family 2 protein [Pseudomonadota bacterium]